MQQSNTNELDENERLVKKRRENCIGIPVYVVNTLLEADKKAKKSNGPGATGPCLRCGRKTPIWCAGCKHYFCMNLRNEDDDTNLAQLLKVPLGDGKGSYKLAWMTCFHACHMEALDKAMGGASRVLSRLNRLILTV